MPVSQYQSNIHVFIRSDRFSFEQYYCHFNEVFQF